MGGVPFFVLVLFAEGYHCLIGGAGIVFVEETRAEKHMAALRGCCMEWRRVCRQGGLCSHLHPFELSTTHISVDGSTSIDVVWIEVENEVPMKSIPVPQVLAGSAAALASLFQPHSHSLLSLRYTT